MEFNDQSDLDLSDQFFSFEEWLEDEDPALMAPERPQNHLEIDAPIQNDTLHKGQSSGERSSPFTRKTARA